MAIGNQVTIVGNLTDDPELRYTSSGAPVATFTVAVNRRTRDPVSGEWKDGETSFMRCNVWRDQAEHVAESLTKGTRAIVVGRLRQRSWESQDGGKRTVVEIEVECVGPSLEWANTTVTKAPRSESSGAPAFASSGGGGGNGGGGGGGNGGSVPPDEEPPF